MIEDIKWMNASLDEQYQNNICMCGTEDAIAASSDPKRMRAVLLSYSFFRQFVYTHFWEYYSDYKSAFPGPMLDVHGGGGTASPDWLVYPSHGFDKLADWDLTYDIFNDFTIKTHRWLKSKSDSQGIDSDRYHRLVRIEVTHTFRESQAVRLLGNNF